MNLWVSNKEIDPYKYFSLNIKIGRNISIVLVYQYVPLFLSDFKSSIIIKSVSYSKELIMKALPEGKIFQLPEDPEKLFEDLPIECSPRWASERVRKKDIWVELGGPKHDYKSFVMVEVVDLDEINPGRIEIVGPDLDEIDSGSSFPFGYYIKLAGKKLNKDYEGFFERWASDNHTRVEGVMYLNTRDTCWMRLHNRIKSKMNSFKYLPQAIMGIFLAQIPLVEAMESKIIIATEELGGKGLMEKIF